MWQFIHYSTQWRTWSFLFFALTGTGWKNNKKSWKARHFQLYIRNCIFWFRISFCFAFSLVLFAKDNVYIWQLIGKRILTCLKSAITSVNRSVCLGATYLAHLKMLVHMTVHGKFPHGLQPIPFKVHYASLSTLDALYLIMWPHIHCSLYLSLSLCVSLYFSLHIQYIKTFTVHDFSWPFMRMTQNGFSFFSWKLHSSWDHIWPLL